jgi:glycosyltransferase involved in cell wall biosynthesis
MSTSAKISVVIPLYNHERYIDAALDSVLTQTIVPEEIIVVDDGSKDGSAQRVLSRAAQDHRIITWSHPNQGAHYTLNEAIHRATGQYVAILNSDDLYHPQRLESCLNAFEQEPDADALCTGLSFIDERGESCRNKWYEQALKFYRKTGDLALALINGNFFMTTSNLFIRRRVFDDLGGFAKLRYAHDLDFFLRLLAASRKIVFLEDPMVSYRIHTTNTISEGVLKVKMEWAAVVAFFVWQIHGQKGWDYLQRLVKITDRHNLTPFIFFFFAQFRQMGSDHASVDGWVDDEIFTSFLAGVVR